MAEHLLCARRARCLFALAFWRFCLSAACSNLRTIWDILKINGCNKTMFYTISFNNLASVCIVFLKNSGCVRHFGRL